MEAARPNLSLVSDADGVIPADAPSYGEALRRLAEAEDTIAGLEDTIAGLEHTIRSQGATITKLKRNREAEAKAHVLWPQAERCFVIWRKLTGRTGKTRFRADRFFLIEPFLRGGEADDLSLEPGPPANPFEECVAAVVGRAFNHFTDRRPNGTTKHFNEWERIFKNSGEFEDSQARRPKDWRERAKVADPGFGERE